MIRCILLTLVFVMVWSKETNVWTQALDRVHLPIEDIAKHVPTPPAWLAEFEQPRTFDDDYWEAVTHRDTFAQRFADWK